MILTGAYVWGRAYIISILKNLARAYFPLRAYFRGNMVIIDIFDLSIPSIYVTCSMFLSSPTFASIGIDFFFLIIHPFPPLFGVYTLFTTLLIITLEIITHIL